MPTSSRLRRHVGLGALALALPVGLAACSSASSGSTTTTRAAGHRGATSACALVTPSQISTTLDRSVKAAVVTNSTAATACTFAAAGATTSDSVIIGFRSRVTSAVAGSEQAAVVKLHGTTTDVSGDGDIAYYYTVKAKDGQTVNTLVTLVGETQVTISSTASVSQAETLTQQIFSSLAGEAAATTTTSAAG